MKSLAARLVETALEGDDPKKLLKHSFRWPALTAPMLKIGEYFFDAYGKEEIEDGWYVVISHVDSAGNRVGEEIVNEGPFPTHEDANEFAQAEVHNPLGIVLVDLGQVVKKLPITEAQESEPFQYDDPKEFLKHMPDPEEPLPEPEDVYYELYIEPESEGPEGSFTEEEDIAWVRNELESGNEWAWCTVIIKAIWTDEDGNEHEGRTSLGGCSYRNEQSFRESNWEDMKDEAYNDLLREIERARKR